MPSVTMVRKRFTIQMRKYSAVVPVNRKGSRRAGGAATFTAGRGAYGPAAGCGIEIESDMVSPAGWDGPPYFGRPAAAREQFTSRRTRIRSDRWPARIGMETRAVGALELRHDAQPLALPPLADRGDGAAAMGREAGSEDDAGIAEVRIGD